jgi:signal transduction histidine kinase
VANDTTDIIVTILGGSALLLFFALTLIFLIVVYRKKQREYQRQNSHLQETFRKELLHAQLESQEHTFKTLSQELHDNIGQVLSLAKLNISVYEMNQEGAANSHITETKALLNNAINDLRDISRMLHSDYVKEKPLEDSIKHELDALEHTRQFATDFLVQGTEFPISAERRLILFRIMQECLSNIVRHAAATQVSVSIAYREQDVHICITDNGVGFDLAATSQGIGIRNMNNRSQMIGAQMKIDSAPGKGTVVLLTMNRQAP